MSPIVIGILVIVLVAIGFATWKAPRLTSIIFWALIATIFFSSAILIGAPGDFSEKALWMTLAVPLIWTVFQFWVYWEKRAWFVVVSLITISVVCGIYTFLSDPLA